MDNFRMTFSGFSPSASIPRDAPPAPPAEVIIARRRRRAIGAILFAAGALLLIFALTRDSIPAARGRTGMPLPGLEPDPADAALARAPESAFVELDWRVFADPGPDLYEPIVSEELTTFSGRPVSIAGFMVPLDPGAKTLDFVLVPDMARCWFCEASDPTRSIYCRGAFGSVVSEYDRPVRVRGVLDVSPLKIDDVPHSLARLRVVRVERL
jgi:hypothetical protein